jgi:hypothetical protein
VVEVHSVYKVAEAGPKESLTKVVLVPLSGPGWTSGYKSCEG